MFIRGGTREDTCDHGLSRELESKSDRGTKKKGKKWAVNIGERMFFGSIVGSDYYALPSHQEETVA